MPIEKVTMPQLGESVTEGTISKWLVTIGDKVNKYDPIVEVMTDKVNAEVPSSYTGKIKEIVVKEDETIPVGEVICTMEVEGNDHKKQIPADKVEQQGKDMEAKELIDNKKEPSKPLEKPNKKRYSPAVLKLSQEHNIDLSQVEGTGKGGRITRKDLLKLIEGGNIPKVEEQPLVASVASSSSTASPASVAAKKEQNREKTAVMSMPGDVSIPVSGVRKAIANNMLRSKQEIPHAWTMMEVDVTQLVAYRDSVKATFKEREGFPLTYFPFFVKAVAQALKEFPQINAMWAGNKIIQKKEINISIAVATDDALYVPVIKNADEKSIKGIAKDITELAHKVRTGTLSADDMQGGTMTVNNTGSFGSVQSMGIINYPQAAILQVETIVKRPVVMDNGMIGIRDMVNLCMSLDHRVLDGFICGRFLQRVKAILENISSENTSIY